MRGVMWGVHKVVRCTTTTTKQTTHDTDEEDGHEKEKKEAETNGRGGEKRTTGVNSTPALARVRWRRCVRVTETVAARAVGRAVPRAAADGTDAMTPNQRECW